jgi:hypothetical protein
MFMALTYGIISPDGATNQMTEFPGLYPVTAQTPLDGPHRVSIKDGKATVGNCDSLVLYSR